MRFLNALPVLELHNDGDFLGVEPLELVPDAVHAAGLLTLAFTLVFTSANRPVRLHFEKAPTLNCKRFKVMFRCSRSV